MRRTSFVTGGVAVAALYTTLQAGVAAAQSEASGPPIAVFRLGPLSLAPGVSLSNLGVDTNVFNSEIEPKRDFTVTLSPSLAATLRAGRTRLQVNGRSDLVYFHMYSSERSLDGSVVGRFESTWNRVTSYLELGGSSGRQRASFELDARSRNTSDRLALGGEVRVAGKIRVGARVGRVRTRWDGDATVFGLSLSESLDRDTETVSLGLKYSMTPLTTIVVEGTSARDRFTRTPARDADSTRIETGFDLAPSALISGNARIGYRRFYGVGGGVERFSGVVAQTQLGHTFRGATRFSVTTLRDVLYSFELTYPTYVQTGVTLTATQRLTHTWDIQGSLGRQKLAYTRATTTRDDLLAVARADYVYSRGASVGYRIGRDIRVGVGVDHFHRRSPLERREYGGFKVGTSVTYGS